MEPAVLGELLPGTLPRRPACELGQGYLFSRPVDPVALDRLFTNPSVDESVTPSDLKVIGIAGRRASG